MKIINNNSIDWNFTEPYSHWQNQVEDGIKRINLRWKTTMRRTKWSPRLWDYGIKHDAELLSRIAPKYGRPPLENLTGDTIHLSEYLGFDFYDQVWYWYTISEEKGEALPGGWIVISHKVRVGMCYWVLNKQGNLISQSTVQDITKEDLLNPTLKETLELDDKKIKKRPANEKH